MKAPDTAANYEVLDLGSKGKLKVGHIVPIPPALALDKFLQYPIAPPCIQHERNLIGVNAMVPGFVGVWSMTLSATTKGVEMAMASAKRTFSPSSPLPEPFATATAMVHSWWSVALRGAIGTLFGLVAILLPGPTLLSLVLLFSAYMLADGLLSLFGAFRGWRKHERSGFLLWQGLANLVTGLLAFLWPAITVLAFEILIASWSIVTGTLLLSGLSRIDARHGRWWLALSGIAALLFGVLLILAPGAGALVLTWWLGTFSLVFALGLLALAFRLRSRLAEHATRAVPQAI